MEESRMMHCDWEWRGDGLTWCSYPRSISVAIEAAYASGNPTIDFRIAGSLYSIRFQASGPRQKNLATGRTRPVKRIQEVHEGTGVSWIWFEKERGTWHAYDSQLTFQIEERWKENNLTACGHASNDRSPAGLFFVIHGQTYNLEFETDAVQYNKKTGFARGVRRKITHLDNPQTDVLATCPSPAGSTALQSEINSLGSREDGIQGDVLPDSIQAQFQNPNEGGHESQLEANSLGSREDDTSQRGPSYNSADIMDYADPPDTDSCCICLSSLQEKRSAKLVKCNHSFHKDCIEDWFRRRPTCPECLTVYGVITGNQPYGRMHIQYISYGSKEARHGLAGYLNTDVIKIIYTFPNGIQSAEHPNPGRPYTGTIRTAYLPKNTEGVEVLELLKKAWSRRLLFRIGTSLTSGQTNVVVWAGIHHKTHKTGGSSNHGYPDGTYFARVKGELKDVGVL